MVFESVVVELLNRYLKPYVKKLDTSQLKVGVWKGHAQLDNLELKEDLFAEADLDVPIKIKRSFIGKLELQIPWKKLTKDPLVVLVDDVYVVLEPDLDTHYDPEKELKRQRKTKEKRIKDYEEAAKKRKQKEKEAKKDKKKKEKDSEKPDTFVEKLIVHLTKNMQVKVRDIHIRYEDGVTNRNTLLAAGVTLHSLELKSTDSNWAPCVVRETATLIYKLVELNCLGIYFNTCARSLASDDLSIEEMIKEMRDAIARPAVDPPPSNTYLLSPMSASARLKMNVRTEVDLSLPQLVMGLECEDIVFSLQKKQFKALLSTVEAFDKHSVNQKYLKYKPPLSLREAPREWWRYAIRSVLEEDVKRRLEMWSWRHIKQHRERCRLYQQKYREKLHSLNPSNTLLTELQILEDSLDWFNIVLCRKEAAKKEKKGSKRGYSSSAYAEKPPTSLTPDSGRKKVEDKGNSKKEKERLKKEEKERLKREEAQEKQRKKEEKQKKKEEDAGGKKKKGFFSKLKLKTKHRDAPSDGAAVASGKLGDEEFVFVHGEEKEKNGTGVPEASAASSDETLVEQDTEEEEDKAMKELYEAIGYAEGEQYEFPKEYIAHEIHVGLKTVTLELVGDKELGKVVTKAIKLDVLNRPSSKSVSVSASVGAISMTGVPKPDGRQTIMLSSDVPGKGKEAPPLVDFQLELNPLSKPWMDISVKTALQPMQITYDFETVDGLIAMFKPPNLIHFQELTQAASASWDQLKSQTTAGLQDALKTRKHFEVDVTLHSPYLVVPENGSYSKDSHLLVVDLGMLTLNGSTKDPQSLDEVAHAVEQKNQSLLYDTFNIELQGMQVLAATPREDWLSAMKKASSPLHILTPTGFQIQLHKSIVKDDAYLPSARVEGTLPKFEVKLSDHQISTVIKVGSSLKKPPALIHRTTMYNELPLRPFEGHRLDSVAQLAKADVLSLTSSISDLVLDEDDEPESPSSLSPTGSPTHSSLSPAVDDRETARSVFTDASIKLSIQEVAVRLTKTERSKKATVEKPMIDIIIGSMKADIVDRKWDTQGSVSMKEVAILDYITMDNGKPTHLLQTECLDDGNFISLRFVTITQLGRDFAAKYTGFENALSAELSLVKLKIHQSSLAGLLKYSMALLPSIKSEQPVEEEGLPSIAESFVDSTVQDVNRADFQAEVAPQKELGFEIKFAGIDTILVQDDQDILTSGIQGFFVKGKVEPKRVSINASIKDMDVKDPVPGAKAPVIVSKVESHKDIVLLDVVQYNYRPHERKAHDLSWVDTSITAELNRISVKLSASFLAHILTFVQKLELNPDALQTAAKATAGTATATAVAIKESTKTAHRISLDFTVHAPVVFLPYSTKLSAGGFIIDLGDLHLSNNFQHGYEVQHKGVARLSTLESIPMRGAITILDCMQIELTSIQILRRSHAPTTDLRQLPVDELCMSESQTVVLEPLKLSAQVIRNISAPTTAFPSVDVQLNLNRVKFHIHEEDVHASISMGMIVAAALMPVAGSASSKKAKPRSGTLLGRAKTGSTLTVKSRTRTRTSTMLSRTSRRTPPRELDVTKVRIKAALNDVSVDMVTINEPLFKASVSGLSAEVNVETSSVLVSASVDSLSVIDLKQNNICTKIVSLAEHSSKVSTVNLAINLNHDETSKAPLGTIRANIAQVRLIVPVPFVLRALDFIQRLDINPNMIKSATMAAQERATVVGAAVAEVAQDKYFSVDVSVHAPVFLLPLNDEMDQALMVDLGSLSLKNTLLTPDQTHCIDAFGVNLDSFKVSRVLLNLSKESSLITAERVLLQPFHLMLAVERNLSPWYTKIPALFVNITMGEFKVYVGQDDLEEFAKFGADVGAKVTTALQNMDFEHFKKIPSETEDQIVEPEQSLPALVEEEDEEEAYDKFRIFSTLTQFQVKIFRGEPKLDSTNPKSHDLSKLGEYGLASLQLLTMEMKAKILSNQEVVLEASMKDIALCDERKASQSKKTGNRVIQHYTSNPIKASTGNLENPIVNITYTLRGDQHIILLRAEKLLLLSDVDFLSATANYFKSIATFAMPPKTELESASDLEETLTAGTSASPSAVPAMTTPVTLELAKKEAPVAKRKPLPKLKVEANIKEVRVAIIEAVDEPEPQALTLKVSTYLNFQLTEDKKQGSLSVVDLSIASSSFFDLDTTTSWVLLPCSMMLTLFGPKDKPAMDINVVIDPISLTVSPAIVRLIIHAAKTLTPEKVPEKLEAPRDLWQKKLLHEMESKLWFLSPVPLHEGVSDVVPVEKKSEIMTVNIESIEIILESECTSRSPGIPVLALNAVCVIQMFEWTGDLMITGNVNCEASYYNEGLSIWEPILEPLENKNGRQQLWDVNIDVTKTPADQLQLDGAKVTQPKISLDVSAASPLQITLTRTALELIKTLADAYAKEYGKNLEGNVNVDSLTGAPFTVVNMLGGEASLFVQPGPALKFKENVDFSKLSAGESMDVVYKMMHRRRSYASLMIKTAKEKAEKPSIDIVVGKMFKPIKNIPIDIPGLHYYTLFPKEHASEAYGLVVDVAVTGVKKTVTIRSSVQFKNHLQVPVEVLYMKSSVADRDCSMQVLATIQPNELYPVPIDKTQSYDYYVRRAGFDFKPLGPPILWKSKRDSDYINFKCVMNGDDSVRDFIRVYCKEEKYKQTRDLPTEDYPHFVFHLYPPVVIQNLLPFEIFIDSMDSGYVPRTIKSGEYIPVHEIDLDASPRITVRVVQERAPNLKGHFTTCKKPSEYMNFTVESEDRGAKIDLGVHTEDLGYLKMSIYSPFWMVNKTGLSLEYKEGYTASHPVGKDIVLFSTTGSKSKIQLRALTEHGTFTEWTKGFALNAVGTSGNYTAKLGEQQYKFGVEVRLSQFTLTKLVVFTPYYLLVNEADFDLHVHEEKFPIDKTLVRRGDMSAFWPLATADNNMVVLAGARESKSPSIPFNYRKSDFNVLQFDSNNEVVAVCVEVQESESATIITFSPYYPGCVPVQIINHFPDMTLQFKQESKSPRAIVHTLAPREVLNFTWDDPEGKKMIRWTFPSALKIHNRKPIQVIKDDQKAFTMKFPRNTTPSADDQSLSLSKSIFHTSAGISEDWLAIDEGLSENLVASTPDEEGEESSLSSSSASLSISSDSRVSSQGSRSPGSYRGYWKSFVDGLQRVLIFTPDEGVIHRIKASNSYSIPLFEASLAIRNIGVSLVDNHKKRELAYIAVTQSGVVWQIDKGKRIWKNVSNSVNLLLEEAYQSKSLDIKRKNLIVNLETMEMYEPLKGKLRRTHYDGVFVKFGLSEKDYSVHAKIGYVQIDNQLPFSVYPQVLYPLPPPPTVASGTEPKPFVEASLILKRGHDQSTVMHFKYVHVLVQKMAVNVDLGFILSLVDFFSLDQEDLQLEAERVKSDLDFVSKSLKETIVPELADDFKISRSFFDVLHLAPIKITLSFNIRSVGKNKSDDEITVGDRFLQLFLHSIGVILTSVQETEMKFSFFHLEYQPTTGRGLTNLLAKHYRNQALFQLHTIIFGLDALGNPVSVVRGVVEGAVDLFYEPIKGSVLGPQEFLEGLGIGLRSFFAAGVLGGITGAGARITGTVGDVFAKLTFDEDFIDKRQQQKTRPPRLGQKLGGFAKNLFEGVTGVVTQPVRGLQKEGAVGLLKGTGRGLVGLLVRPTGGLVDLASGTLSFVSRKTQVGNIEITDIRPPRFIARDGIVTPYSPSKALGNALLVNVDEGKFVESDFYYGHVEVNAKPVLFVLVTDRRFMLIERRVLGDGWNSEKSAVFEHFAGPVEVKDVNVVMHYLPNIKGKLGYLTLRTVPLAMEVARIVNEAYMQYIDEQ